MAKRPKRNQLVNVDTKLRNWGDVEGQQVLCVDGRLHSADQDCPACGQAREQECQS